MTDKANTDDFEMRIATNENGLSNCGCGENALRWRAPKDYVAHEADHSLEEAKEIKQRALPWKYKSPDDEGLDRLFHGGVGPDSWDEWVEREQSKAERNGLTAYCGACYGSMSPTVKTDELVDHISE